MRGLKTYKEIIKTKSQAGTTRRGRNDKLLANRNDCLLARYLYYGVIKNKCFEDILRTLVEEFFISPTTIGQIIQNNTDALKALKQRGAVTFYFQSRWPHLKW